MASTASDSWMEALAEAAKAGDYATAERAIQNGAPVNGVHKRQTALHHAAWHGHAAIVDLLVRHGADIEAVDPYTQFSPLLAACHGGNLEPTRVLLAAGADVHAVSGHGTTALCLAAASSSSASVDLCRLLLENGASLAAEDKSGATPLFHAGSDDVALLLYEKGAHPFVLARDGMAPFDRACSRGFIGCVTRILKEHLAPPSSTGAGAGAGSCTASAYVDDESERQRLLAKGLLSACYGRQVQLSRLLLEAGAPADHPPLSMSTSTAARETTVLHVVARDRQSPPALARLLLAHGASVTALDGYGQSPFDVACSRNRALAILLMEEYGIVPSTVAGPCPPDEVPMSNDQALVQKAHFVYLCDLFEPELTAASKPTPIPPHRRTLRWALNSPGVAEAYPSRGAFPPAAAPSEEDEEGQAKALSIRKALLKPLNDDAWERRKHLVVCRAKQREAMMARAQAPSPAPLPPLALDVTLPPLALDVTLPPLALDVTLPPLALDVTAQLSALAGVLLDQYHKHAAKNRVLALLASHFLSQWERLEATAGGVADMGVDDGSGNDDTDSAAILQRNLDLAAAAGTATELEALSPPAQALASSVVESVCPHYAGKGCRSRVVLELVRYVRAAWTAEIAGGKRDAEANAEADPGAAGLWAELDSRSFVPRAHARANASVAVDAECILWVRELIQMRKRGEGDASGGSSQVADDTQAFARHLEAGDLKEQVGKFVLVHGGNVSCGFETAAEAAEAADDAGLIRPLIMHVGSFAGPLPAFKPCSAGGSGPTVATAPECS